MNTPHNFPSQANFKISIMSIYEKIGDYITEHDC